MTNITINYFYLYLKMNDNMSSQLINILNLNYTINECILYTTLFIYLVLFCFIIVFSDFSNV